MLSTGEQMKKLPKKITRPIRVCPICGKRMNEFMRDDGESLEIGWFCSHRGKKKDADRQK